MPYETVICTREEGVGVVTLNRPEQMNALNSKLKEDLALAFGAMERDLEVKVVVLTGSGKAFCSGADIKERSAMHMNQFEFYLYQRKTHALFSRIEDFEKPVIAAVNGIALGGGCELALASDMRIASETSRFGLPEAKVGIIPAGGGTQRLPRLIGAGRAKELLFTGDFIDAHEALRVGLVNRVVQGDGLMKEAVGLARKMAKNSPLSLKFAKRAVNVGMQLDLASALDYEAHCASLLYGSGDREEGFRAFMEKREPHFKGR
jgi:enoyl-CoA hydratase